MAFGFDRWICPAAAALVCVGGAAAPAAIVGSWDFEEASGSTVYDGAGSFNATIGAGTGARVSTGDIGGNFGQSWSGGTAEILTANYAGQYNALTSMSLESWIKWDGTGTANYWLTINAPFSNFIHTGVPGVRSIMGGVDSSYLSPSLLTPNQWQQWVTTYDAPSATMRVYVNGTQVFSGGGGSGLDWAGAANDKLGLNSGGTFNDGVPVGGVFQGLIDHLSIHDVALTPTQVMNRFNEVLQVPNRPVNRFVLSAWGTHRYQGGEIANLDIFDGSGLNTFFDGVRSGSSSSTHPYTIGLPSLLLASGGDPAHYPGADLQGFIDDFNAARARQGNIMGVILGDEIPDNSRTHYRAVRDWIVNNPDPSIAKIKTLHSNYPTADWDGLYADLQFDTGILQVYPQFFNPSTFDEGYLYTTLDWWSGWTKSKGVGMWVYTQNFGTTPQAQQTASDLRLQRFAAMAYGATGIVDFAWDYNPNTEFANGGYYWDSGQQTSPTYPIVAPINEETKRVGNSLARMHHISTHHRDDEYAFSQWEDRPSGWDLLDVTSPGNSNSVIVSYFTDVDGEQYWMVVNKDRSKTLSPEQLADNVTLTLDPSINSVLRLSRADGTIETIPVVGGSYTFSLLGGTGDLFKFNTGSPFVGGVAGDFNNDNIVNATDVDLLCDQIHGSGRLAFDVNEDNLLNNQDFLYEIQTVLSTTLGDADLDGDVDLSDLGILATYYGSSPRGWGQGDFDCDEDVDLSDLGILATYYGTGAAQAFADFQSLTGAQVPEPMHLSLLCSAAFFTVRRKYQRYG